MSEYQKNTVDLPPADPAESRPEINGEETSEQQLARDQALEKATEFLRDVVPVMSKITGLNVHTEVGQGWGTDLRTGDFTIDPSFFLEKGYSADHCVYATLHELMAHVRDVVRDPACAERQMDFWRTSDEQLRGARHIFNNILSDIHGNKTIHELLPRMRDVASDLYETRLFAPEIPDTPLDLASRGPMHLQFLYKIIRQEMIDGSETIVRPEVDEAIESLRDFKDTGFDVISYLTDPGSKDNKGKKLSGVERFDQQVAIIYPIYEKLIELDKEEAKQQKQQQNDQSGQEPPEQDQRPQDSPDDSDQSSNPFKSAYKDYFDNKHPEPLDEKAHEDIHKAAEKTAKEQRDKDRRANETSEQRTQRERRKRDREFCAKTGHSLHEQNSYRQIIEKHRSTIDEMREVFGSVLNEIVEKRRGLSRRAYADGDLLHPGRLAQTYIDVRSGTPEPEAYQRYERVTGRTELACKTDYFFVFDTSGSMWGEPAEQAATSAVIMLEALAGMERDIRRREREEKVDLEDLQIRTALYTFGFESQVLKELGTGLDEKQRLDAFSAISAADGGSTADFLALEDITTLPSDHDRQRVVIVVSDGESNDPDRAAAAIDQLRQQQAVVYGIAIGSTAAERLYAPYAKLINDPAELPQVMQQFIERTIR